LAGYVLGVLDHGPESGVLALNLGERLVGCHHRRPQLQRGGIHIVTALVQRSRELAQDQLDSGTLGRSECIEKIVEARRREGRLARCVIRFRFAFDRGHSVHLGERLAGIAGLEGHVGVSGGVLLADRGGRVRRGIFDRLVKDQGHFGKAFVGHLDASNRPRDRSVDPHEHALEQREGVLELGDDLVGPRRGARSHIEHGHRSREKEPADQRHRLGNDVGHQGFLGGGISRKLSS
jgi:hypothetical protein